MRSRKLCFAALIILPVALLATSAQTQGPRPLTLPLACPGKDCTLLSGAPQTAGMRSGFVRLKPGETVGWHSTEKNEETLVVLRGKGEARVEGQPARIISAQMLVYFPPATRHNVANTGMEPLEYVYIVAPARHSTPSGTTQ